MISYEELKKISRTRIRDAQILWDNKSYDGALYLCGYAIELALKSVVCKNLNPVGKKSVSHIPSTGQEFKVIESIKTHDLEKLLQLAPSQIALEIKNKTKRFTDWSTIQKWDPEMRYAPIRGQLLRTESLEVIEAASRLLRFLWRQI